MKEKKNDSRNDSRIKVKHFSWKEIVITFSVLVVLGIGQALVLSVSLAYLDFSMVPVVFAVVMVIYWIIVAAVYSLITHYQMRKKFDEPLQQLGNAAEKVASGDFSFYLSPIHTADKRDYIDVMYEDFNKMVKELGSIETLKNDFVANVSHEIKTPLNIIRNYAYTLKKQNFDINERDEYIDTIISSADNLTALVTNILKLNRLENQEILPITEPYDLCRQLSDIVMALDKPLENKNINLAVEMDDQLLIRYDPGMIELVWHNLLSNAVKFTPPGGVVTLKQTSDANFITVSVSDTGCGMDDETIKRIFDKFYQSDTSHSGDGNGLGLALVRRILELVGGDITVHSKLGEGTTFTVRLAVK